MCRSRDWSQSFLLTSDRHWDNPKSLWSLQKQHLDEAVEKCAGVIDCGDFYCLMQGKGDARGNKGDIRPEHNTDTYIQDVIDTSVDFFAPYAGNMIVVASGNHEDAVLNKREIDVTREFVTKMRDRTGHTIHNGGCSGFVNFKFAEPDSRFRDEVKLFYYHGAGAGGSAGRGITTRIRSGSYVPDANIVITGHIHESYIVEIPRQRNRNGKSFLDTQHIVCVPTYKEEYGDGSSGWHVRTGKPPKPVGAWWLQFYYNSRLKKVRYQLLRAE